MPTKIQEHGKFVTCPLCIHHSECQEDQEAVNVGRRSSKHVAALADPSVNWTRPTSPDAIDTIAIRRDLDEAAMPGGFQSSACEIVTL